MMTEKIEHNEHRRPADDRREPVAWAGRAPGDEPAPATAPGRPAGRDRA
jgi:hypothetical protein